MGDSGKKRLWWHFLPQVVMALLLAAFMVDPWTSYWGLAMVWPLIPVLIVTSIIVLVKGIKKGGTHKKLVLGSFGIILLGVALLFLVRMPAYGCDPDKMAKHYEKTKDALEELAYFTKSTLNEGDDIMMDLQYGTEVRLFQNSAGDDQELEAPSGRELVKEDFEPIKKRLKDVKCVSIYSHFPDYCDIGYKVVGFARYSYRLYLNPMTEEQRQDALTNAQIIPYNDKVSFLFEGGAAGAQSFSQEYKEEYLKNHPPQWTSE